MTQRKEFRCSCCGKSTEAEAAPVCCGKRMEPLPACTRAQGDAEHARTTEKDGPCDEGT